MNTISKDRNNTVAEAGGSSTSVAGSRRASASPEARPLRLLMIVESSGAGTGRHVLDLCEGLCARGCEVHLIYSDLRMDSRFESRLKAMPSVRSKMVRMRRSIHPSDFFAALKVRRYIKENGPFDAVHGHSSKGGAVARLSTFGTGVHAFYTPHGLTSMDPNLSKIKRFLYQTIEIGLSRRTARIIAVAPEESRGAVQAGLGESRVIVIPNGVGSPDLRPREDARRELRVSDNELVIGFVGRLVEAKAPHVLLHAFARTIQRLGELEAFKPARPIRLAMVGGGEMGPSLHGLADELGIRNNVIWLGERDAREVMAAFDVFAMSSRKEGLPYVILEAMAAGLPVVATASSGVEILIDPDVNGIVVPMDDVQHFSDALFLLATDSERLLEFGEASRERAKRFTIEGMVEQTLDAYVNAASPRTTEPVALPADLDDEEDVLSAA